MTDQKSLKQRVEAFRTMQMPGQTFPQHMGTFYLVNDLWREIERLNAALSMTREGLDADDAKRAQGAVT